jgi:hypothetical protein
LDYTKDEFEACWYSRSKEEFEHMKRDVECTVDMIERGCVIDNREYCERGLESKTKEGSRLRHQQRKKAIATVLGKQLSQQQKGKRNEHRIAAAYQDCSYQCKLSAYITGVSDQMTVQPLSRIRDGFKHDVGESEPTGNLSRMLERHRLRIRRLFSHAA